MAITNIELMHECSPEQLSTGTARRTKDKDTEKEGKKRVVNMKGSTAGRKGDLSTA